MVQKEALGTFVRFEFMDTAGQEWESIDGLASCLWERNYIAN